MTEGVARIAEAVSQYLTAPNQDFLLNEIVAYDSVERANERLLCLTGIRSFFPNYPALEEFRRVLTVPAVSTASSKGREWGDFQTPPGLASQVCQYLSGAGISPRVIIEPTFGAGNFIIAALSAFPQADLIYGVEIQEKYEWHLKLALLAEGVRGKRHRAEIELHQADIFTYRFPDEVLRADDILVVGNAPWVTNAELGAIGAGNLPIKANFKGLNGLDAVTGKGNFDIGEFVLLRMLDLFSKRRGTLAMLCKNSVIKNIVEIMSRRRFNVSSIRAYKIDAKREFGASVDASLLVMEMGAPGSALSCRVSTLDQPDRWERTFGWTDGKFVADLEEYQQVSELDGQSPVVWRQGLKHDCARIMEVDEVEGTLVNGNGEKVDVEDQWVYPFFKSSDLRGFEAERARKRVIITQRYVGDDTSGLQFCAPRLWSYLVGNRKYLDARKSRIYQGRP
ncbi:MAG: SAM-dependent methyltransferase, partial [Chloroflexi bacterium]|nr:SAM-dependent methyltransferase [Chloroflexota bacterium]